MQHVCSMEMLLLLSLLLWNEKNWALATQECGSVVNNTLTSPGYPNNYPNYMDCEYWVPVPHGMTLIISFQDFVLENHTSCGYDYLKITNEKKQSFGVYCGEKTGKTVNIAFQLLNPFPMKMIRTKREYHLEIVKRELAELDKLREDYVISKADEPESRDGDGDMLGED